MSGRSRISQLVVRDMGLVGPFALGQGAGEEALPDPPDRRVVRPEPRFVIAHCSFSLT